MFWLIIIFQLKRWSLQSFLKEFIALIQEALLQEGIVKIKSLGTFKLQWNESRKSVNVNTGEEIEILGHYKVSFTAETELKEFINKPFTHLDTEFLDDEEPESTENVKIDPIKRFSDQAIEIASLISELSTIEPLVEKEREEVLPEGEETRVQPEIVQEEILVAVEETAVVENEVPVQTIAQEK